MVGLYEKIKRECKPRKNAWAWKIAITTLFCFFAVMTVSIVWFLGYHGRFTKFVGGLSDSTTYAYNNDSLIATLDGKAFRVSEENMYGIFAYLSLNKSGRESKKVPSGDPVSLDYGNGTMLELWDMSAEEGHPYLFVLYTDKNGNVYSYISYRTTLDTVVSRYLTYGNDEI